MNDKPLIDKIYRINQNVYFFFAGILVSFAIELSLRTLDVELLSAKILLIISMVLTLSSGYLISTIGWQINIDRETSFSIEKTPKKQIEKLKGYKTMHKIIIIRKFIVSISFTIIGVGLVLFTAFAY